MEDGRSCWPCVGHLDLMAAASTSCQNLANTINGIKNPSRHVRVIGSDLKGLHDLLSELQALLEDEESTAGVVQSATSESLSKVLENVMLLCSDINSVVNDFTFYGFLIQVNLWRRVKWMWKDREFLGLRLSLIAHETTLNLGISGAELSVVVMRAVLLRLGLL